MATADVGHPAAGLQALLDTLQRGDPVVDESGPVRRLEEGCCRVEQPGSWSCQTTPFPDTNARSIFGWTPQMAAACAQADAM